MLQSIVHDKRTATQPRCRHCNGTGRTMSVHPERGTVSERECSYCQPRWRLVHDLRNGRRSEDIRIGDLALTDSGLHELRGGDGQRPMRLWKVTS